MAYTLRFVEPWRSPSDANPDGPCDRPTPVWGERTSCQSAGAFEVVLQYYGRIVAWEEFAGVRRRPTAARIYLYLILRSSSPSAWLADDTVRVDDVERRPVVIRERSPDRVVVVECDRVLHPVAPSPPAVTLFDVVLERRTPACARRSRPAVVAVGLSIHARSVPAFAEPVDAVSASRS